MNYSFSDGPLRSTTFSFGANTEHMMHVFEQLRSRVEKRAGSRMGRGDVRIAILALLSESPMHGYQIIREIEARSDGAWKPSAGSVYPTLQLLADEGLIEVEESNGRKTYKLTELGSEVAAEEAATAPWESAAMGADSRCNALPKAGFELAQAAAQVMRSGSAAQIDEAAAVLDDARKRLYAILAQE